MPENQTDNNTTSSQSTTPVSVIAAAVKAATGEEPGKTGPSSAEIMQEVMNKISGARNILVALSADPSVDEISAAIGLSLCLDRAGKRATAIYSGTTPNALEFLKPDKTFETSADALQDFVIALNKEKADHLRYKLDGDFVKIYVTPYKARISEDDLEFAYGDFNIDLVLALDVANGVDLDEALREHGRIMHDATIINITTGNPGKFGEIEWSDKTASSVSEMAATLLYQMNKSSIEGEEATAFLTGIIAATNRFSNANTTPATMEIASKLMASGADQQLITKNIEGTDNQMFSLGSLDSRSPEDLASLDIKHDEEELAEEAEPEEKPAEEPVTEPEEKPTEESKPDVEVDSMLDELKATADSLSDVTSEIADEPTPAPVQLGGKSEVKSEKVLAPSADFNVSSPSGPGNNKYGQMLEDALSEATEPAPVAQTPASATQTPTPEPTPSPISNPAINMAPPVADKPEINGVPEINYMAAPADAVLPPPPTPPIDTSAPLPPNPEVAPNKIEQPSMQDQVYNAPAVNPGAFKIPDAN